MSKNLVRLLLVFILLCFYSKVICQPLNLYWNGKTDSAILIANKIILNKTIVSQKELINAYDFLAEYNLEQGHFENFAKFIKLQFSATKNSTLDSALYYARLANYFHCYVLHDSASLYCKKAITVFRRVVSNDSLTLSRYYSYIGNASRNTEYRNIDFCEKSVDFASIPFLKALHCRRFVTFLTDWINIRFDKWTTKEFIYYKKCKLLFDIGEKNATKIYSNKKSSLHSSLYKIWALALDYRGKFSESIAMSIKTKSTLVEGKKIFNFYEYSAISSWEAVTNTKLYYASGNKKYLYLAEKTLLNTLPIWEKFYAIEHEDNSKSFDDRYSINPYQGLLITYYELYKITHEQVYLYKCYGLSEILKGKGSIEQTAKCFDDNFNNKQIKEIIALSKKNNCAIVSYLHTQQPPISAAIVFLEDTAFIVMNNDLKSNNIYLQNYDYLLSLLFNDKKNELKNYAFNLYYSFFKNIDSVLQKKAIKQVIIIPDGFTNSINFDLLQTDSIKQHSLSKSALINKYKFTYQTSGDALLKSYLPKNNYTAIELIMPSYQNSKYAPLNSSLQLFDNVLQNDFIIDRIKTNAIEFFEENNQLVQFVGHVKSNPNSYLPSLILTDSSQLSFSEFQGNLKGNSYLLNGCGSALGKVESFHKTNSFPYHLIDKGASSVICSLWQLDDKENADFLAVFYNFLKTGSTSSDALHKTKLHFINKGYPSTMWAAYLYYGNDFYLSKKSNVNIYLYISIAIIAGCLSFLVVKQVKKRE